MSASGTLQKAAEKLRGLAKEATPGPWSHDDENPGVVMAPDNPNFTWDGVFVCATQIDKHGEPDLDDAEYIATMSPLVGLALADWLEFFAGVAAIAGTDEPFVRALAVARAVLGGAS